MGRGPVLGRPATAAEAELHERAFVAAFVPERLHAQALACLAHRKRPRAKYRSEWSGFVANLPMVPREHVTELRTPELRAAVVGAAVGDVYVMTAHLDWDGRLVGGEDLVRIATADVGPREFVASMVPGHAALWRGEHGTFSIRRRSAGRG